MAQSYIRILDGSSLNVLADIYDIEDAYVFETVNDKYTFDFSCYPQAGVEHLTTDNIIVADSDYFRIYKKTIDRADDMKITLSCEHISYELNIKREPIRALYNGTVKQILQKMIDDNGVRFNVIDSEFNPTVEFATEVGALRSRMIEFAEVLGAEIKFNKFDIVMLPRRGHDYGLTLELGKNLIGWQETYEVDEDGSVVTSYEIDFIDLNKVFDKEGQPLEEYELHLGDDIYLIDSQMGKTVKQRAVSVGYNPFRKELPTIKLTAPNKDINTTITNIERGGGGSRIYSASEPPNDIYGRDGDVWIVIADTPSEPTDRPIEGEVT